jgi:hypothetical protein
LTSGALQNPATPHILSQPAAFAAAAAAVMLTYRQCNTTGYQPFAKARTLRFDIRSNTQSNDPFASSTPRGRLPSLKLFMMNVSQRHSWLEYVLLLVSDHALVVSFNSTGSCDKLFLIILSVELVASVS